MTKSIKKKLQRFLVGYSRFLGTAAIILVILILIPLSVPRILGYQTYDVISGSMEPEIPVGSLVLVKEIDPHDVKERDIIAFYSNNVVVCHRVVINDPFEGEFTTKGDANTETDLSDPTYSDLIGIVKYHIPLMGMIGSYVDSASGKLMITEVIVCAIMLHIVASKIRL